MYHFKRSLQNHEPTITLFITGVFPYIAVRQNEAIIQDVRGFTAIPVDLRPSTTTVKRQEKSYCLTQSQIPRALTVKETKIQKDWGSLV